MLVYDMESQQLLQLDLTQSPVTVSVRADANTHPGLDQVGAIDLRDFAEEGRKCLARREYETDFQASREVYTLFSDADNDGVFESSATFSRAEWEASTYSDASLWHHFWRE